MEITLWIKGQELRVLGKQPNLYHGSMGVLYIKFFDENFDATLIKTVRFRTEESEWYTADVIDGRVRVPHEVIVVGGFDVAVGAYETRGGELLRFLPTNSVHIDVFENGFGSPDAPLADEGSLESVIAKFAAGIEKKADLEYVNSLIPQNTVTGKNVTVFDHMEGVETVNVRVFGNSVQQTRSGKNLLDIESFVETFNKTAMQGYKITREIYDGKECFKVYGISAKNGMFPVELKKNTRYSISMDYIQFSALNISDNQTFGPMLMVCYTDGTSELLIGDDVDFGNWRHVSLVTDTNKTVSHIRGTYSTGAAYTYITNWQLEEGTVETEYEEYGKMPSAEFPAEIRSVGDYTDDGQYSVPIIVESDTSNSHDTYDIRLNEPLRRINDVYDYIDYKNQCIVRNIEVLDDSGTLSIEESFGVLDEPVCEKIEVTPIILPDGEDVNICIGTNVETEIKINYYQDINKKIAQLEKVIENI